MRKLTVLMGMLLVLGLSSACSGDDEMNILKDSKLALFEDSLQSVSSVSADDYIGYMHYDVRFGWYIQLASWCGNEPFNYYPLSDIPEELKEVGLKVSFSGEYIRLTDEELESLDIENNLRASFFLIYLTKLEKIEIPYRGTPPFTITDMPGKIVVYEDTWYIAYVKDYDGAVNLYLPTELSEEFQVSGGIKNVIISGNVYEDITDSHQYNLGQKVYRIELTKIENLE